MNFLANRPAERGGYIGWHKGETERIAVVVTLGGIQWLIVLSIVRHSALKNE